jgi:hypothetical protein
MRNRQARTARHHAAAEMRRKSIQTNGIALNRGTAVQSVHPAARQRKLTDACRAHRTALNAAAIASIYNGAP